MTAGTDQSASGRSLWYLCLELPVEGQASHTHVMGILRGLDARGWRTRLWSPQARKGRRGAVRRLFDSMTLQARLMLQRKRPDVLYVRGHFASLPTLLYARLRRIPVVWELNGAGTDVLSSWPRARRILPLLNASANLQMRLSSTAIGVTPALARWATEHGARTSHVVGNGADTKLFSPSASTTATLPDRFVSFTGTLAKWQGIDSLFEAMERPAWPRDIALVVVGDGVLTDVVRDRSAADPRVRYLGRLPHGDVAGVVARSLAALSPMYAADRVQIGVVPLKLFEAMACGVPVIVTDLPGQADIVTLNACGIVVPPNDPDAIARAVAQLADQPELARSMGERARSGAVARYSWDAAAAATHAILIDLLDG
jgi:glycosyltransferase involved in cell wall biosynthesis